MMYFPFLNEELKNPGILNKNIGSVGDVGVCVCVCVFCLVSAARYDFWMFCLVQTGCKLVIPFHLFEATFHFVGPIVLTRHLSACFQHDALQAKVYSKPKAVFSPLVPRIRPFWFVRWRL